YVAYPPQGPAGLSKEPRHPKMDGVSTNLALIFGTLLSSQGTDASFVLTLSGFPPGFPSVLRFRLYQILSASDSQSAGVVFPAVGPFRRVRL
ncbi:hypothetical protein, partial [Streptomyces venezuelae]|uniref:hypothetical protein n=1 Tax=Streptomyces venezuelae TaxID=54571 RepID=UPI001F24C5AB